MATKTNIQKIHKTNRLRYSTGTQQLAPMQPIPRKALLLDMDGVILHQPKIHSYVSKRVVSYVQKMLEPVIDGITYDQADKINRMLYTTYGHTYLGLNRLFNANCTITDFNRFVYSNDILKHVVHFEDDKEMNIRANEVRRLVDRCYSNGTSVYIFSNAPTYWSNIVTSTMGLIIDSDNVWGTDHPIFEKDGLVKPMPALYKIVDRLLQYRHGFDTEIVFMDDALINLQPCSTMPGWTPVLLAPGVPSVNVGTLRIRPRVLDIMDLV